jgi:hypothetical protein
MHRRRRLVVLALFALPLVCAPIGLAVAQQQSGLTGTLRTWHGDTFTTPVGVGAGVDTTIAGLVPLESPTPEAHALAGHRVKVHGVHRGGSFVVSGGVHPTGAPAPLAATGTRSVAVILFNFSNATSQPWTLASVRGVVFDNANSVDEYYRDASYGKLALSGDVFGWYTIAATNAGCAYTTWATQARAAAVAAGVNIGAYQHVVYAFPQASSCGWAGLAYLPGSSSWINGAMTLRVVGHELGHNFGVHHASTLACTTGGVRSTFGDSCTQSEYGDPFTIMGSAQTRHHVNWHRAQLGWVPDVQALSSSTVLITPAELSGASGRFWLPRGDGTFLNLEFRQPFGLFDNFSPSDPVVNGVSIRIAPSTSSLVQSKLVDANPSTTTFLDAALGVGQTVVDPSTGVSITTLSVGLEGALVSIQAPSGPQSPVPGGPPALPTGAAPAPPLSPIRVGLG